MLPDVNDTGPGLVPTIYVDHPRIPRVNRYPKTAVQVDLEGLRGLLKGWDGGDEDLEKEKQNSAKATIYSMYTENALAEDTALVGRWTETLNILLTFAGLQSAIVTTFIIALDPNLRLDSKDTTVEVLRQILHRLDNSTAPPEVSVGPFVPLPSTVNTSAWWYLSLACSLLSAFGALLSKQWVLHYQTELSWVTTIEGKAQLRESRYQGMRTWQFFGVIESLPILLQLSILFFAIGLAQYLQPASTRLFILALAIIALGVGFYLFTLISGILFPSSPFKSPITTFLVGVYFNIKLILKLLGHTAVAVVAPAMSWTMWTRTQVRSFAKKSILDVSEMWREYLDTHVDYMAEKEVGEAVRVGDEETGAGGVLCWWLFLEARNVAATSQFDPGSAISAILSFPPKKILSHFEGSDVFGSWCVRVVSELEDAASVALPDTPLIRRSRGPREVDALCHFMYHSKIAFRVGISAVGGKHIDEFWGFCKAFRNAFQDPNSTGILPVLSMEWTTVAVYFSVQLRDWCDRRRKGSGERRAHLLVAQELPILLRHSALQPLFPKNAGPDLDLVDSLESTSPEAPNDRRNRFLLRRDVANIMSLAAVSFVDDSVAGVRERVELTSSSSSVEQILLALHRLSYYHHTISTTTVTHQQTFAPQTPEELLPLLVRFARHAIDQALAASTLSTLVDCQIWKNGEFGDMVLRLLNLATLIRDGDGSQVEAKTRHADQRSAKNPGGALVREVTSLILLVFDRISSPPEKCTAGLVPLNSPTGLATILNGYATNMIPLVSDPDALRALNYVLGLRYYNLSPSSRFSSHRPTNLHSAHPPDALSLSILKDDPSILRQFIHDIQMLEHLSVDNRHTSTQRRTLLSIAIKGRDLFLPLEFRRGSRYEQLTQELDLLADKMFKSGTFLSWSPVVRSGLDGFQKWDDLLQALKDLQEFLVINQKTPGILKEESYQGDSFELS